MRGGEDHSMSGHQCFHKEVGQTKFSYFSSDHGCAGFILTKGGIAKSSSSNVPLAPRYRRREPVSDNRCLTRFVGEARNEDAGAQVSRAMPKPSGLSHNSVFCSLSPFYTTYVHIQTRAYSSITVFATESIQSLLWHQSFRIIRSLDLGAKSRIQPKMKKIKPLKRFGF